MAPAIRPRRRRAASGSVSRIQSGLARRRRDDGNEPDTEQQHQGREQDSERGSHFERCVRKRRNRHGNFTEAANAVGSDAHLPGACRHHPQASGEQPRVGRGPPCDVGHGRELGAGTGERQRHDPDLVDIVAGGENLDLRDAGNRVRRPDGDQQAIRTGRAIEEDVRAADVGRTRQRRTRGQRKSREEAASHRRTRCMARPARMPA